VLQDTIARPQWPREDIHGSIEVGGGENEGILTAVVAKSTLRRILMNISEGKYRNNLQN
jgi:hypothetical protein